MMSIRSILLPVLFFFVFVCWNMTNRAYADECIIKGIFVVQQGHGNQPKKNTGFQVRMGIPIDGLFFNKHILEDISIDKSSNRFEKPVTLQQAAVIPLFIDGQAYYIYAEPGSVIDLRIEVVNNKVMSVRDIGALSTENNFFISKLREDTRAHYRNLTRKAQAFSTSSEEEQWLFLDSCQMFLDYHLEALDSLSRRHELSASFMPLARAQLTYHAIGLPFHQLVFWEKTADLDTTMYHQVVDSMFVWVGDLDSTKLSIDCSLYFGIFRKMRYPSQDIGELAVFKGYRARTKLPEPFDRQDRFNGMVFQFQNGSAEFPYPQAFEAYANHFPKDGLYQILDSLNYLVVNTPIRYTDSDETLADSLRSYKFYIENGQATVGYFEDFDSLAELLSTSSRGKPVFIDFWATWCTPCIAEFSYNKALVDSLSKRGIGTAYISIDHRDSRLQWENVARSYQLIGVHILLSEKIYKQIRDELELRTIPRYMFVTAGGKIVLPHAGRPSDLEGLLAEIDQVYH